MRGAIAAACLALIQAGPLAYAAEPARPEAAAGATRFPTAAAFSAAIAPLSSRQHADMVRIAAGEYAIGAPAGDPRSAADAQPAHRVRIAALRIDRTEVPNAQFVEYLNALPVKP